MQGCEADAEPVAHFDADVAPDLPLLGFAEVERLELLLRVISFLRLVQQAAELGGRRSRDRDKGEDDGTQNCCFHTCASLLMPAGPAGLAGG